MDWRGIHRHATALARARRSLTRSLTLAVVLLTLAGVIAVWPFASLAVADARLAREADATPTAGDAAALTAAEDYNEWLRVTGQTLIGSTVDPLDGSTDYSGADDPGYSEGLSLDADGLMGRVTVPSVGIDLPVWHGSSPDVLTRGAGHLPGTSLPTGGAGTHAVLTGHSNLRGVSMFTGLSGVRTGDVMQVRTMAGVLSYRVSDVRVAAPSDVSGLRIIPGADLLTLVTCTGGGNQYRLLVTGERVPDAPVEGVRRVVWPWIAAGCAGGLAGCVGVRVWRAGRASRGRPASRHGA
ncbi:class C sortase [Pseudoscardovia radai]|uniref:class C sortase n=1 Tax=Pseudoscardovia radai TaxID=987066 RepID=UPI003995F303